MRNVGRGTLNVEHRTLNVERGQTTTEYLMIAGIMTAIGIFILTWMFFPWRETTQDITDCVRTDDCEAVGAK